MNRNRKKYAIDLTGLTPEEIQKKAYLKAVDLLYRQPYPENKLKSKLLSYGYSEIVVNEILQRLKAQRFLNDYELCYRTWELYLERCENSLLEIRSKLYSKGFKTLDIANVWEELQENYIDYEYRACCKLLISKYRRNKNPELYMKYYGYLGRKGFASNVAQKAIGDFLDNE